MKKSTLRSDLLWSQAKCTELTDHQHWLEGQLIDAQKLVVVLENRLAVSDAALTSSTAALAAYQNRCDILEKLLHEVGCLLLGVNTWEAPHEERGLDSAGVAGFEKGELPGTGDVAS